MTGAPCITQCLFCGCCGHGEPNDNIGCRAAHAPTGMRCPGEGCGCEGAAPTVTPSRKTCEPDPPAGEQQLHQELSLFTIPDDPDAN